jgi:hypothetical protein
MITIIRKSPLYHQSFVKIIKKFQYLHFENFYYTNLKLQQHKNGPATPVLELELERIKIQILFIKLPLQTK